jgi:hypothetical protein
MKSDIGKGQETLEDHQNHTAFLEIIIPDDIDDPSQFFDVPQKMIDSLAKIETVNFLLARIYQFYDEDLNDAGQGIEEATAENSEEIPGTERLLSELP